MCKKVLVIATLAVVAAVMIIGGRKTVSLARYLKQRACVALEESVPVEQEIARLRMELKNLDREDSRHFERVARQCVEVEKLDKKVSAARAQLAQDERRLRAMRTSLAGAGEAVTYDERSYDRTRLDAEYLTSGARFLTDEKTLQSMEEQLAAKKLSYEQNRKKLADLKLRRQQMVTELQQLETAWEKERQAQAQEERTVDDSNYRRIRRDIDATRDRINVKAKTRELKAEVSSPVRADEETASTRRNLESRLGARDKAD